MRDGMRERSLQRMDEIVNYYSSLHNVLAVVAFGSNAIRARFDNSSDLDFLVLAEPQAKAELLSQVSRLEALCPIDAMQIQYGDAVNLLFSDGVYCDFGIVMPDQLATFPHGAGAYLWRKDGWEPVSVCASEPPALTMDELTLDALFHLYVGLLRCARGEEAAAFYEVQVTAAQKVLSILEGKKADAFSPLRRAEKLVSGEVLQAVMPGYGYTEKAVEAMLTYLSHAAELPLYKAVQSLLKNP